MKAINLALFSVFCIAVFYVFNSAIARKWKRIELKPLVLYVVTLGMLGAFGEVFVGNLYYAVFGRPLWLYHVLPVHVYTSLFAPIIWGILGFHLYLLHGTLNAKKPKSLNRLAFYFAGETILVELFGNGAYKLFFHDYLFYYFPSDLWHLTSVQTLPFYLAAGFVVTRTLSRLRADPVFFSCMACGLAFVLVCLK